MRSPRRLGAATASVRPRPRIDDGLVHLPLVWSAIYRTTGDGHVSDVLTRGVLTGRVPAGGPVEDRSHRAHLIDAALRAAEEWNRGRRRVDPMSRSDADRLEIYECCERLERTLASEPPAVRDAMLLVYVAHRSCREVADDLGTSVTDVRRGIDQGLARLADVARGDRMRSPSAFGPPDDPSVSAPGPNHPA